MVDVSHEPRWGRIAEGARRGPVPRLGVSRRPGSRATRAQTTPPPTRSAASVKHFVAYGQPEGGRDYNTTDMSEARLRNIYLPPFKAAIDAGADTVMCSFNAINGVPGCANSYTETDILKKEWGFDGFIESDYTAVAELRACPPVNPATGPCGHGVAADGPSPAAMALKAGTDSEMVSTDIRDYGQQLLASGRIAMARLNDAVRRILRVKFRAGLFDHPYVDRPRRWTRPASSPRRDRAAARTAAGKSMVLLKNEDKTLPLSPTQDDRRHRPARRRPARHARPVVGPGPGRGRGQPCTTGIKAQNPARPPSPRAAPARTSSRRTARRTTMRAATPASAAARAAAAVRRPGRARAR